MMETFSDKPFSAKLFPLLLLRTGRAVLGVLTVSAISAAIHGSPVEAAALVAGDDPVARGNYLVEIADCSGCHTPFKLGPNGPEPDFSRLLSGHPETLQMPPPPALGDSPWAWVGAATNTAFAGPWGVSYAANLTPDKDTGTGSWTEAMFVSAIRTGKHLGAGRPLLPPMPWPAYSHMTDDDLRAVFAYLRTITPITNHVPNPAPPAAAKP
jgi:mono/diheme cytochrome c family protein